MAMSYNSEQINKHLENLQKHLADEYSHNPTLANAVKSFREIDAVGHSMGLLEKDQSYATYVTWWPMIAVLGTFSAGKSTYINSYLNLPLQRTGNQAVDDKFTVICYSHQKEVKTLPGIALDADPRFPFFQISKSIDEISEAGQERIDAYLQLKTCPSENIRGKILIDSPGFDADNQRASTLRLTQHIINLSDLVLVFFDARHPEPKAMQDTLAYLVSASVNRADANKFLYILNQIDVTAKEDNPEEVVSAWQRSLAEVGLVAGRFYRIYNLDAAVPITNPGVKERFEKKRAEDMADINTRIQQIEVERSYRIVAKLEQTAKGIKNQIVPKLSDMLKKWKSKVILLDSIIFGTLAILAAVGITINESWESTKTFCDKIIQGDSSALAIAAILFTVIIIIHFSIRRFAANSILKKLSLELANDDETYKQYVHAFNRSTAAYRLIFLRDPAGWNGTTQNTIDEVINKANDYIQILNDQFTNPSGHK